MSNGDIHGRKGRAFKRAIAIAGMAAMVFTLGACASRTSAPPSGGSTSVVKVKQVAIVTPADESDHGWNQQGVLGAVAAADALGVKLNKNINVGYDNTQTILTQIANKGNDLVFAHASGFATAAARAAASTGVPMLVDDVPADTAVPGQVGVVNFEVQQGSYLAGIAAAMATKTGTIGIVASAENVDYFGYAGGFIQGARSVKPDIKVIMAYIGANSYADSAGGKKVAAQVIAAGADVILGMGDGATVGYIAAVEAASTPVKYIATIGQVGDLAKDPSTVLATVEENFSGVFKQAIKDVDSGSFGKKPYSLTVVNGGLTLVKGPDVTPQISAAVDTATKGIKDGSIVVNPITTKAAVTALLNK